MHPFSADQESPFLKAPDSSWIASNGLAFAVLDQFPVSPGHTLVVTRRVVPSWFDATASEQAALMDLVNEVKRLLDARCSPTPDGYNVGFNSGSAAGQTVPHVHIHVIPRYAGDMADPRGGVRHVIPNKGNYLLPASNPSRHASLGIQDILSTGHPDSSLWSALEWRIPKAKTIDIVAAFVQVSGLELIRSSIFAALRNGAHIRILAGDYLYITNPRALRTLNGWSALAKDRFSEFLPGRFEARLAQIEKLPTKPSSFHPKSWHIVDSDGAHLVVGSSNLSRSALRDGLEWNLLVSGDESRKARRDALAAFNQLWDCASELSPQLLDSYQKAYSAFLRTQFHPTPQESGEPLPLPRPWQIKALAALTDLRAHQCERALVTVATGMGKTWLAAFDIRAYGRYLGRRPRVLVIAHRSHILAQAEGCLSRVLEAEFPNGSTSWFLAAENDLSGDLVLASVQKLSRPDGLAQLKNEFFDYTLIDEVHHAEAPSYRQVLAQLKSGFVLGLTATPERSDGVDIASVFDDHIAYSAGIGEGIAERVLVPFYYVGIKDTVDFEQIPWRNGRFDVVRLEQELLHSPRWIRLGNALEAHPANRTLFFCVSKKHALFTRDWLLARGSKAAAVFSGGGSDSYALSLAGFQSGCLDSLCVVDMFNEGLDIPAVDRVVMLRPTESKVVFLQQLGRGLREAKGKERLLIIDFVGNHRIFARRMIHLLSLGNAPAGFEPLRRWIEQGVADLPEGCFLDVELEAKDLLRRLLPSGPAAALEGYRALRDELGRRPHMVEVFNSGFLPRILGAAHGGWHFFLRAEGDLEEDEISAFEHLSGWFATLEKTSLNKSYKMVVVRVLLDLNVLWEGVLVSELAAACRRFLRNHPVLSRDLEGDNHALDHLAASDAEWGEWWRQWPLDRWQQPSEGVRWFTLEDDRFRFKGTVPVPLRRKFEDLSAEIVDYRLAHYARSRRIDGMSSSAAVSGEAFRCKVSHSNHVPILRLDRSKFPGIPTGPTSVMVPDGRRWAFKFVKVAVNVAHAEGSDENQLFKLLRDWFGSSAGLPGTNFTVRFEFAGEGWSVFPERARSDAVDQSPEYSEYPQVDLRVAEESDGCV
jgi:superfamily II DNA or RNA helicase/diadenosine tetraphosphate (Ap4A) HIT family hydrolase/HKD family nuclease